MPLPAPVADEAWLNADPPAAAGAEVPPYTVSVRSLCEFTAKRGDLDRRFTPAATALEGIAGQQTVSARRGPDYESEVALEGRQHGLRVRGRADGYDPRRRCLEEVKTIRGQPEDIPENRRQLHWAQLQTYGALFCRLRKLSEVTLALVYLDVETQSETELRQVFGAQELDEAFAERCAMFAAWAAQEGAHRRVRDQSLRGLAFPPGTFRTGQRTLAEAVYRAASSGRCLLAQAPTGIGKTMGTLFPLLRAMPDQGIDKIAYLTCKGTGRLTALQALADLRAGLPGQSLRVLSMVPRDQACEHPDKACHGDACPLARGFHDRLPAARHDAVAQGWMDAATQRSVALRHGICPYYLGQELVRWADVLVGDVHHYFDASGQLWGWMQALDWKLALLVDEAHNLVERARQMYTAELRWTDIQAAAATAPAALRPPLTLLAEATAGLAAAGTQADAPYTLVQPVPDPFLQALQAAAGALASHFRQQPLATGGLLGFHFSLQRFLRLVDALGEHSLFDLQVTACGPVAGAADQGEEVAADRILCVRNVMPAGFLRQRLKMLQSLTLFSATLAPPDYAIRLLGLPEDTAWIDVPAAFPPEHLTVQVAGDVSTRFTDRHRSLRRLVGILAAQFDAHPGNYLAFFSSFEYLDQAAAGLARARPDIPQWR
jgi:DNA excision repair protein ERCC-2